MSVAINTRFSYVTQVSDVVKDAGASRGKGRATSISGIEGRIVSMRHSANL
jgi:hypothetical protein